MRPVRMGNTMRSLRYLALSSALLLSPLAIDGAFAQSSNAGSNAPPSSAVPVPQASQPAKSSVVTAGPASSVVPPTSATGAGNGGAQGTNPPGAQPGAGSGLGKTSGTAAGN
ncbi:hypothetical protein Dimus_020664 [Dionaea muscipula]